MNLKNLQDLRVFVAAAETGSLSAAANLLDLSPAVASASLKRLEEDIGIMLLTRSTRSLRPSLDGARFLPVVRQVLRDLDQALEGLSSSDQLVLKILRISMPSDLGRNHLLPWLDEFQTIHPGIRLRVSLSDRSADFFSEPVDMSIRYSHGKDSSLVALPLHTENRRVLCAAPAYIARCGMPASPEELVAHNCLCYGLSKRTHRNWEFSLKGQRIKVAVAGDRVADDGDAVHRWALAGFGIAYKSMLDVSHSLAEGRLIQLCPEWTTETAPLFLVYTNRGPLSATALLLQEYLVQQCESLVARWPAGQNWLTRTKPA